MALTYGIIFILAVAVIDIALVLVYRENQLKKNESFYLGLCSMLSSMAENNVRITNYINNGEGLAGNDNGRVLLLDSSGRVLLDSGGELTGVELTNPEFRKASKFGKPATGYYEYDGKGMAVFSYPVTLSGRVSAVVMVSVFIQDIYEDIGQFTLQVTAISMLVVIVVVLVSIYMGKRLSRPIVRLTHAVESIYSGRINTTVEISRNDEIGVLAGTFNRMSGELNKIETGRRRFISDVSHELKTPLASIKALLEALISGDMNAEDNLDFLNDINHEIDRLNGLVGSLLTSARLEEVKLYKESLLLADEVDCVIRALSPLAEHKHIRLENACDHSVYINADRNMLREVLINLIDNGVKYGVEGGFVRVESDKDNFKVVDNGIGIPEDDLPNIFENFYRVDRSRSNESGSGIGLFIVKRIIELHGFRITVTSKPSEGSEFMISGLTT